MQSKDNQPLVSIVIPCYNCEEWVQPAVESCLNQTYPNIEIIVIDDGSTDRSLEILRQFLPRIELKTGPNRGGNSARNTGFALSTGEYIQFLDADDYLEPDKIARQVRFLEETGADVVYGDWRHKKHLAGSSLGYLDRIEVSGAQPDIVASLLSLRGGSNGLQAFWLNGGAVLYRRQVVNQLGGWDETLRAAQDMDFITSVALSGAKIGYQPGCHFVHRQYGRVTVSSSNLGRWLESYCMSLNKSEVALARTGRLTPEYRTALAIGYLVIAQNCYWFDERAALAVYEKTLNNIINKILNLYPNFNPAGETRVFQLVQWLFGFRFAVHLLFRVRSLIRLFKGKLRNFLLHYVLHVRHEKVFQREAKRHSYNVSADVGWKGRVEQQTRPGPR
jgi:glycosyltransferase involved in cell wall biosynthesis